MTRIDTFKIEDNRPCRSCGSGHTVEVMDLGQQRLSDFIDPGQPLPEQHELKLCICLDCTLVQLSKTTPRHKLYHERYGFRSGTNEAVRADLADVVKYALAFNRPDNGPGRWLDIACNDGTLLSYVPTTFHRTGVDPVSAIARDARRNGYANRVIYDYFDSRFFAPHEFDVITSVSMFYDLDKINTFVDQVERVLAPGGVWVIQQNYAGDMIRRNAVDNICHEHVTYFSQLALMILLERHGLEINDVVFSDVNGGCIRTAVSRIGDRPQSASVQLAYEREVLQGLHRPELWMGWGRSVKEELELTRNFLRRARDRGETVYLYGASTRGGTFLQMIDAGPDLLPFAVERSPAKVGKIMGSTGIEIIDESRMRAVHPEYLLVSPWFFRDVFVEREANYLANGGKLVFPLPHFEIVGTS